MKTAAGGTLGPMICYGGAVQGYLTAVAVYFDDLGRIARVNQRTGDVEGCSIYFSTTDCTGSPFVGDGAFIHFCHSGNRLWSVGSDLASSVTVRSYLSNPEGTCYQTAPYTGTLLPALELFDSRYPYAAPLRIVYE